MRYLTIAFFFIVTCSLNAQILNVESLRKVTDTAGWSGSASLNFALYKNVSEQLVFSSNIHVQYKMNKHLFLIKNYIAFQKIDDSKFSNSGILHLRHNYKFHSRIAWETFIQAQYNRISLIDFRGLVGTGPRFKLSTSEKYKLYVGTLVMYEHEKIADGITPDQHDFRGSAYLSFSLYPTDRITIVSTTYYQPKLSAFGDYRISSESSLDIVLFSNFSFTSTYTFTYDAFPAVGIPMSQYEFTSGVTYAFD